VLCTLDGGSAGSQTQTCSWTYTVHTLEGVLLGQQMTPQKRRPDNMPFTPTPDETVGTGYYDLDGEFILFDANETFATEAC
jgi:hypothetical protein